MDSKAYKTAPKASATTPNDLSSENIVEDVTNYQNALFAQQQAQINQNESQQALQNYSEADPNAQENQKRLNENESQKSLLNRVSSEERRSSMTPSDGQPRNPHSSESRHYNGSLDHINPDSKRESNAFNKDRHKLPTFGEDDFDTAIIRQQNESPPTKTKMTRIDRMLEDHRNRKAQREANAINSQATYPFGNNYQDSTSAQQGNFHAHDYNEVIEEENGNGEEPNQNQVSGVYSSIKLDNIHQGGFIDSPQATSHDKRPTDAPKINQKTGKFADSNMNPDFIINTSNFDSARDSKRKPEKVEKRVSVEKKSVVSPKVRKEGSQELTSPGSSTFSTNKNSKVPKISANSQKIYRNSGRAKEDELIIQEIIAARLKLVEANKSEIRDVQGEEEESPALKDESPKFQTKHTLVHLSTLKTCESPVSGGIKTLQLDKTGRSERDSPSPTKVKFDTPLESTPEKRKSASNYSSPGVLKGEISKPSPIRELETSKSRLNETSSTINNIISGKASPKKSNLKKTYQYLETFATPLGPSLLLSAKNVTSNTVVEHKKKNSLLDGSSKNPADNSTVTPTAKEIKEMATATKQIYVKVVDTRSDNVLNGSPKAKSPKKSPPVSSGFLREMVRKADGVLSPEELKQFDEVQRLEIMLYNLKQMQQANLISQVTVRRTSTSSPKINSTESIYSEKQGWNKYAENINDSATGRRSLRKKKEDERLARFARSESPQPMEKQEATQESLLNSVQMRQEAYSGAQPGTVADGKTFQGALIKSWEDVGIYERQMLWLSARNQKVDQIGYGVAVEGMKDCSFKPHFFTKKAGEDSQLMSSRNEGYVANRSSFLGDKSLYKEKKALDNYTDLSELKKDFNVYKNEFFLPNRSQIM